MEHVSWFDLFVDHHLLHGAEGHPGIGHILMACVALVFLTIFAVLARMGLARRQDGRIPESKLSVANVAEIAVGGLENLCEDMIGHGGKKYLWLLGSIFLYIFTSNLLGVLPGFLPPTDNVNTNLPIAICVFLAYNFYGLKEGGIGYLKHFMGPVLFLAPLMIVIEVISHLVRPASLTIRLYGNIFGDHLVLGIFSDMVPLVVPVIFLALGIFVSFIQAFVFTLLSMVYVALATAHHEDH